MPDADLDAAIDELYGAPLEAFVAERTRLAKALRQAGDRPAADRLAKMPKPSPAAWALNRAAREDPSLVDAWLEATVALRDASARAGEVGGDTVRAAMAEQRAATVKLTTAVTERAQPAGRPLSAAMVDRVRAILQAATGDPALAERLRAGRVTEEAPAPGVMPETAPRPSGAGRRRSAPAPEPDREAEARAARRAELERRRREAEEEAQRRRAHVAERAAASRTADERLEEARRTLHRRESEADAAREALRDAVEAAATAEADLERLRAKLEELGT